MVPGELRQVKPCLIANPLLGLIWASYPLGNSTNMPVGTRNLSIGFNVSGDSSCALMSMPAAPSVAYSGKGLLELLMIRTLIFDIRKYILDFRLQIADLG